MSFRQPLIPTRVVNKNGIPTTVYKTPQGETALIMIPSVKPFVSSGDPESGVDRVGERVHHVMSHWSLSTKIPVTVGSDEILEKLSALPDETKHLLAESSDRNTDTNFVYMVISMLYKDRSPREIDDVLYCFDNTKDKAMMTINDDWTDHGFDIDYGTLGTLEWTTYYNGRLTGYSFRGDEESLPLRAHNEKTRAQVMALVDATNFFAETDEFISFHSLMDMEDASGEPMLQIRDTALAQLLVDMPERYTNILETMRERRSLDAELIRSILTTEAPAVNNGVL